MLVCMRIVCPSYDAASVALYLSPMATGATNRGRIGRLLTPGTTRGGCYCVGMEATQAGALKTDLLYSSLFKENNWISESS